jgi:hypothetical protein
MRIGSRDWKLQQKALAVVDAERWAKRSPFGRIIDTATGHCLRAATQAESESSGEFVVDGKTVVVRP